MGPKIGKDRYVAIFGALDRELVYIRSEIRIERRDKRDGVPFWVGLHGSHRIVLVKTGVGPDQSQHAARVILSSFPIEVLLSIGFACALKSEMRIGDLVVGAAYSFLNDGGLDSYAADAGLLVLADQVREDVGLSRQEPVHIFKGPIVTVGRMIEKAAEKTAIAHQTDAIALDMESAAIAGAALDAKVAFLSIRCISDLVDEELRGIASFVSPKGTPQPLKGILNLFFHPMDFTHLNRLRIHTSTASKRLGCFVHDYLHRLN